MFIVGSLYAYMSLDFHTVFEGERENEGQRYDSWTELAVVSGRQLLALRAELSFFLLWWKCLLFPASPETQNAYFGFVPNSCFASPTPAKWKSVTYPGS